MKSFFNRVLKSVWGPDFYNQIEEKSIWGALRQMSWLLAIISVLCSVVLFIVVVPLSKNFTFKIADYLHEKYPEDLQVSIIDGVLSSDPSKVYNLDFPREIFSDDVLTQIKKETGVSYLFTLDTVSKFESLPKLSDIDSLIFVTKDNIVIKDDNRGKVTVHSVSKIPNILVNKSLIEGYSQNIKEAFLPFSILLSILGLLLFFFGSFVKYGIASLLAGLIVWTIYKISKDKKDYWLCVKYALFGMTLPIILGFVFFTLGMPLQMHFISAVLLSALIVIANKKSQT